MSNFKKISLLWLGFLLLSGVSTFFSHSEFGGVALLSEAVRFLLFIISIFIVWKEPNRKNKFLFLNFALFFSFSVLHHLFHYVGPNGSILTNERYSPVFYYQYVDRIGFYLFLSIAIVYAVLDSLFRQFKVYQKYVFTFVIVGGFAAWFYYPYTYLEDPKNLYTAAEIRDWKTLDTTWSNYVRAHNLDPDTRPDKATLATLVNLHAWKDGTPVGNLYPEQNAERIEYLVKYLEGDNYRVLLWTPMHLTVIRLNVVCVLFLFLFFGYQYKKDPPQGAYVDKIMFLFLLFCSMEGLHALGYINALEWSTSFLDVFSFGQYVTIGILLVMILFFSLRLRFITSVKGEFYESELVHNAQHITRWRDWVDNLVVHYFLNPKALRGRFLALWTEAGKKELAKTAR